MAEINKLSAGKALDKLRGNVPESKSAQRDNKISALEEETRRTSAMRRRLEMDQQAAKSSKRDAEEPNIKKGYSIQRWGVLTILGAVLLTSIIFYAARVR